MGTKINFCIPRFLERSSNPLVIKTSSQPIQGLSENWALVGYINIIIQRVPTEPEYVGEGQLSRLTPDDMELEKLDEESQNTCSESVENLNPRELYQILSHIIPLHSIPRNEIALQENIITMLSESNQKIISVGTILHKILHIIYENGWKEKFLHKFLIERPMKETVSWIIENIMKRHDTPGMIEVYNKINESSKLPEQNWAYIEKLAEIEGVGNLIICSSGELWDQKSVGNFIQVVCLTPFKHFSQLEKCMNPESKYKHTISRNVFYSILLHWKKFTDVMIRELEESLKQIGLKTGTVFQNEMVDYTHRWLLHNNYDLATHDVSSLRV